MQEFPYTKLAGRNQRKREPDIFRGQGFPDLDESIAYKFLRRELDDCKQQEFLDHLQFS
jgi:hypothetical protein